MLANFSLPLRSFLTSIRSKHNISAVAPSITMLYESDFGEIHDVVAWFHSVLNQHFVEINRRITGKNFYYTSGDSQELSQVKEELFTFINILKHAQKPVELEVAYLDALEKLTWLSPNSGCSIEESYIVPEIIYYEPIFRILKNEEIKLKKSPSTALQLKMRGSGSYANVYSFKDPDYGIRIALKRLKSESDDKEKKRFEREFEFMKKINSPFVLKVYKYNPDKHEYTMEFCDYTLYGYIQGRKNNNLNFKYRKRIAEKFLHGVQAIHRKGILHRDLSFQNVLIQEYDDDVVDVKISDFGLARDRDSDLTALDSELKGSLRDPSLNTFKDYKMQHEIYSIGWILSFIFTGKKAYSSDNVAFEEVLTKCRHSDPTMRYATVDSLLADIRDLPSFHP